MADSGSGARALLDRYDLRELVGRGGMGEVWMGWDRRLQREVAVKLLLPELSAEPAFRERFAREARIAAALDHPNVVNVYDIDEDSGALFIVMERLPGPSLDRRLAEGPLSEDELRRLAHDMLAGLGAAHREGLIHRDIKPGNLIRSAGGRWKVGDFGVAKDLASTAQLTMVGVAVGTPAYLAPEQLAGRAATPATDLWAAAIVLREALTGQRPFSGDDPIAVAHAVQHTPLAPLRSLRPDIDPALTGAVDRALTIDPLQRFTSAEEMAAAIDGRAVPAPMPPPAPGQAEPGVPPPLVSQIPPAPPVVSGPALAVPPPPVPPAPAPGQGPTSVPDGAGLALPPSPEGPADPASPPPAPGGPASVDDEAGSRRAWWLVALIIGAMMVVLLLALTTMAIPFIDDGEDSPAPTTAPAASSPGDLSDVPLCEDLEPDDTAPFCLEEGDPDDDDGG